MKSCVRERETFHLVPVSGPPSNLSSQISRFSSQDRVKVDREADALVRLSKSVTSHSVAWGSGTELLAPGKSQDVVSEMVSGVTEMPRSWSRQSPLERDVGHRPP